MSTPLGSAKSTDLRRRRLRLIMGRVPVVTVTGPRISASRGRVSLETRPRHQ
jgi:hypothetical protein